MDRWVADWLGELGLAQYAPAFAENGVGRDLIVELTNDDLKDLGVQRLADRKKLLAAIETLRTGNTAPKVAAPRTAAPPRPGLPEAERRRVAILFADLSGFTRLSSELGAESTHDLLNRYFAVADAIVEECGGRVDKHIGDNVMAVFGAPVAHPDDPERAVRAALAIHAAVARLGQEIGRELAIHAGIASGQVVASGTGSDAYREYTVTGDSVNLASRLQDKARNGETVISDALHRAIGDKFECEPFGDVAIKGLDAPVRAWRVTGMRQSASAGTVFAGRRIELAQFAALLESCVASGTGRTIQLRGEAGIGKSRVAEEFARLAAQRGFAVRKGQIPDFGAAREQETFRTIARELAGMSLPGGDAEREAACRAAVVEGMPAALRQVYLSELLGVPLSPEERAAGDGLTAEARSEGRRSFLAGLMRGACRHSPLLVVVEDAHWADRATLSTLARLAAAVAGCPALLVVTSRFEGDPLDDRWRAESGAPLTVIDLGPLGREEAAAIVGAFAATDGAFAERCVERAGGNPLFLEQLLRNAEESADSAVPGNVQSLVQSRIDRLDPADKTAMQVAAVLGLQFDLAALAALLDREDYDPANLVSRRLLRPIGQTACQFAHALIRDAIYDTLLTPRRRELHRRAAAWHQDRDPALRAEHLARAQDPAAADACLAAARMRANAYRHEEAASLARAGLACAVTPADRFGLHEFLGGLLLGLGATAEASRAYSIALDVAPDEATRCRAFIGMAEVKRVTGDRQGALADIANAQAVAERLGMTGELARIHFLKGNLCFLQGDIDGCLLEHEAALAKARQAGQNELEAMALGGLGDAQYMRGQFASARDRFRECVEASALHGFGRIEVANRPMAAMMRWINGETLGGLADAEAAIEAANRVGQRRAEMIGHHAAFFCRHSLLDLDAAFRHADTALALARQLGARHFEAEGLVFRSEIHRVCGRGEAALADAREAVRIARESAMNFIGPMALGKLALATGEPAEVAAALREGRDLLARGAISHNHVLFRRDAIDAYLRLAHWDDAESVAAEVEEYTRDRPMPLTRFIVARARALARHGRNPAGGAGSRSELEQLRTEARSLGQLSALPEIDRALA